MAAIPQKVFDFSGTPAPRQAICFTFLVKIIDCLKPLKPYALLPFIVGVFFLSAIWGLSLTIRGRFSQMGSRVFTVPPPNITAR